MAKRELKRAKVEDFRPNVSRPVVWDKADGFAVGTNESATLVRGLSRSAANKVATAINVILREITFRPKSSGARSRRKGHQFERDISILLREIFPDARRHLEYQDAEANGIDIVNTGRFAFQCKKLKQYASVKTIEEIQAQREFGDIPVLVTAADKEPAMAVLHFEDFLELVSVYEKNTK